MTLTLSFMLTREQLIKLVMNPNDVPTDTLEQRLDIQLQSSADFWLYCVTQSVEPRLFTDFNADTCVIIKDRREFSRRLSTCAYTATAAAPIREGRANYVDPLLPKSPNIFVPLSKLFGYTYQDEYRFCWLPEPPLAQLEYIDIEVGSISDIADLVVL